MSQNFQKLPKSPKTQNPRWCHWCHSRHSYRKILMHHLSRYFRFHLMFLKNPQHHYSRLIQLPQKFQRFRRLPTFRTNLWLRTFQNCLFHQTFPRCHSPRTCRYYPKLHWSPMNR
jgi:hypothetical protein